MSSSSPASGSGSDMETGLPPREVDESEPQVNSNGEPQPAIKTESAAGDASSTFTYPPPPQELTVDAVPSQSSEESGTSRRKSRWASPDASDAKSDTVETKSNENSADVKTAEVTSESPAPPKRKSRWGSPDPAPATDGAVKTEETTDGAPKKRSRWSKVEDKPATAAIPTPLFPGVSGSVFGGLNFSIPALGVNPLMQMSPAQQQEHAAIQAKLAELDAKMLTIDSETQEDERERSPSPEPVYDALGKRLNTRPQRRRERLMKERATLLEKAMQLNPALSGALKPVKRTSERILIPVNDFPDINFMGLIIGPRGNTQKRMEQETGCKISIRGKGAHDKKARREGRVDPDENEPLHVLVVCQHSEENLDKCVEMIKKLMNPNTEDTEQHKAKQLRELASINGTVKMEQACRICGEMGHKIYDCPNRTGHAWTAANVMCTICGMNNHIEKDCPQALAARASGGAAPSGDINSEYLNFMAELTGDASVPKTGIVGLIEAGTAGNTPNPAPPAPASTTPAPSPANPPPAAAAPPVPPPVMPPPPAPWGAAPGYPPMMPPPPYFVPPGQRGPYGVPPGPPPSMYAPHHMPPGMPPPGYGFPPPMFYPPPGAPFLPGGPVPPAPWGAMPPPPGVMPQGQR